MSRLPDWPTPIVLALKIAPGASTYVLLLIALQRPLLLQLLSSAPRIADADGGRASIEQAEIPAAAAARVTRTPQLGT
jgi:hypothetical protein